MLLKKTNRKPYTIYRMVPFSMTLSDLTSDPDFKVTAFFEVEYHKNGAKDKITIPNIYEMVLCLVTLTDL